VHDEAHGEGYLLQCECCVASLPAGSANADGEHRRRIRRHQQRWEGGGGCEAAGGVHLALSRLVRRELPMTFRPLLRREPARARLLRFRFRLCGAAQRYLQLSWTAPLVPRSSSSATDSESPLDAAQCSGVHLHGGGDSARRTPPIHRSGNGAPDVVLGVHVGAGSDERSDDSAIAADRRPVQRGGAIIPVHGGAGVRGWAPRGYPSPQPVPENKTARRPRGSTMFSIWVTVNDREYSERTRSTRHLASRSRASIKRAKLQKVAETAIAGEGGGEKSGDSANGRGAYESRNLTL
jgi:hypothetical protein